MPASHRSSLSRLKAAAAFLEVAAFIITLLALAFRATLYWQLPVSTSDNPGLAPLLDFSLAMLLFAICLLCAGVGVAISLQAGPRDKRHAYQAFFIGVLCFVLYDLLYPYVPRLM